MELKLGEVYKVELGCTKDYNLIKSKENIALVSSERKGPAGPTQYLLTTTTGLTEWIYEIDINYATIEKVDTETELWMSNIANSELYIIETQEEIKKANKKLEEAEKAKQYSINELKSKTNKYEVSEFIGSLNTCIGAEDANKLTFQVWCEWDEKISKNEALKSKDHMEYLINKQTLSNEKLKEKFKDKNLINIERSVLSKDGKPMYIYTNLTFEFDMKKIKPIYFKSELERLDKRIIKLINLPNELNI